MELSEFVRGLIEAAVKRSERIGRSDMVAAVYDADGWEKAFRRAWRVRSFAPVRVNETLAASLAEWLGDAPAREVAEALTARLGQPAVFRAEKEDALLSALSSSSRRCGAFYTTEDAFFAVFETHAIAFIMGNFD